MTLLILLGASTRAAAMSAWRAGWKPWCADLFADADLKRLATARQIPGDQYPGGLLDVLKEAPPAPVLYTGALENRPDLIARIDRPLLGNSADVLRAVRSPRKWTACLRARELPCPLILENPTLTGPWLLKPRKSAAGFGVRDYAGQPFNSRTHYLQEKIEGVPCSAVFRATKDGAMLLGVTQQLIGSSWLNASGFHYAGSIGPLLFADEGARRWRDLGVALAGVFQLRGMFGVDAIMRDGIPWPVEINPRYTASVEVIERYWGQAIFEPPLGKSIPPRSVFSSKGVRKRWGKAILFARATFTFPADGPWLDALKDGVDLNETEHADIPHAGTIIEQGRPVLTLFASAATVSECETKLKEKAQALDRRLWG